MSTAPNIFGGGLWGQTLWGGPASDPPDASFPASDLLNNLYPRLHAHDKNDLVWWTEAELLEKLDEAADNAARTCGIFIWRSEVGATVAAQATYPLPENHVSTLEVEYDGVPLVPTSTAQLSALDDAFESTAGDPTRWYQDQLGLASLGLYPVPDDAKTLTMIHHGTPPAIDKTTTQIPAPRVFGDWLENAALGAAYEKESELRMTEVSNFLEGLNGLYVKAFQQLWGVAE